MRGKNHNNGRQIGARRRRRRRRRHHQAGLRSAGRTADSTPVLCASRASRSIIQKTVNFIKRSTDHRNWVDDFIEFISLYLWCGCCHRPGEVPFRFPREGCRGRHAQPRTGYVKSNTMNFRPGWFPIREEGAVIPCAFLCVYLCFRVFFPPNDP